MSTGIPFFRKIQSEFDLNGPTLSMQRQPVGTSCSVASGIATFIGIGTAIYPPGQGGRDTNTGLITHQWHKVGVGALTDGVNVTGSGTTTLTLSGLTSPSDNGSEYFCQIGYTPNALSPNAINEPFDSASAALTVLPTLSIVTQPSDVTILEGLDATFNVQASVTDNSTSQLSYQWYLNGSAINGATSSTLSISRSQPSFNKVYCSISHPTAQPGIVTSTEAKLDVSSSRALLNFERFGGGTFVAEKGSRDIGKMGALSFRANAQVNARIIVVYAPEEDIEVKITMGGAAGQQAFHRDNVFGKPGEGGISVFKTTLKRNHEYLIKLGVHEGQGGGPRGGIAAFNSGMAQASYSGGAGGGIAAIYHKAKLIAVCGGGGGGAYDAAGVGGDGGGLQVVGENGTGTLGGRGGQTYRQGSLPIGGMTQAGRTGPDDFDTTSPGGGRIGGCTTGSSYWRNTLGFSPCQDIPGLTHFRNAEGTVNTATAKLERGYKSGQGYRNNGGANRQAGAAAGGAGANGGSAAGASGWHGGGGGSGYASDEVELLPSSVLSTGTRLGGNDDVGFICFELFRENDDHVPCIPPKSDGSVNLRTVNFSSRENGISFVKSESQLYPNINLIPGVPNQLAFGAASVSLGPNEGRFVAQMARGDKYDFWFATAPLPNGFELRLDMSPQYRTGTNSSKRIICDDKSFGFGGLTQLVGGDNDFDDLVITVDQGHFVLNKTGTVNSLNLQPSSSDLQYIYDVTV